MEIALFFSDRLEKVQRGQQKKALIGFIGTLLKALITRFKPTISRRKVSRWCRKAPSRDTDILDLSN